ncbi:MAG: energy transducer TonB [candidate division Zixibacteria bacterium]
MSQNLNVPYGAFELKQCYQKNMLIGILMSTMLAIVSITTALLLMPDAIVIPEDDTSEGSYIHIEPRPIIVRDDPVSGGRKKRPEGNMKNLIDKLTGRPVMISDLSNDKMESSLMTNEEIKELIDAQAWIGVDPNSGIGELGAIGSGEQIPKSTEFVPVEINPEFVHKEEPIYPRLALEAGFDATLTVEVFVGKEGKVLKAQIAKCTKPKMGFEEEALKAAYKSVFSPAIQNGQPVGIWISYVIKFIIDNKDIQGH